MNENQFVDEVLINGDRLTGYIRGMNQDELLSLANQRLQSGKRAEGLAIMRYQHKIFHQGNCNDLPPDDMGDAA
jgi:hypothetical protein